MSLYRAIATVGSWTMASRVLGFARDVSIAAVLGAGPAAEAFVVAFRLPNLFRRLFAEGALAAAFVPVYTGVLEREGRDGARRFASETFVLLGLFLLGMSVLAMAFMPAVVFALAPGFKDDAALFALAVGLSTVTFPYLLFMALTALLGGVLNAHDKFAAAAAAPVVLNLVLLAALGMSAAGVAPAPAAALAWGVALAGVLQFLLVARACARLGLMPRLGRPRLSPAVKRLLVLMGPGVVGAGVVQINLVVATQIASFLEPGAIAWLYYADRLVQLPLGVIGVAVGVALLPALSRSLRQGAAARAEAEQNRAIEFSLLFTLPATAALIAMPLPIVDVLFRRGAFDAGDAAVTADILAAFALGLPAYVLVKTLSPGFFAREDTATPVKVAALAVAVNVALALALMGPLGPVGVALASSAASWANVGLLAAILARRGGLKPDARLARRGAGLLAASALMGAALWGAQAALPGVQTLDFSARLALLAGLVAGGGALFFALAHVMGAARASELAGVLRRRRVPGAPGAEE